MRRKYLVGVLVGVLTLGGAIAAWAVSPSETTLDVTFKPSSKNGGTNKKPQRQAVDIIYKSSTTTGSRVSRRPRPR